MVRALILLPPWPACGLDITALLTLAWLLLLLLVVSAW
jgi:hypothetical protein